MSDYPTVPQEIGQPIDENLQKLAELFPAAVKDGALDVEALREELGDFAEIQPGDEKYELNWVGKQAAKKKAFEPLLGKTLALKDDGKNADTTENLYIEGDNLEALKLLRQNYYGEVKMIYIDPPYNTGEDFVYNDSFKIDAVESDQAEGLRTDGGDRLVKNEKSSNRYHARWLDLMYPRLKLAKDLLKEDGAIFISIDDWEDHNLRKICDEIFGEGNLLNQRQFIWHIPNGTNKGFIARAHEYVLGYAKNINKLRPFKRTGDLSSKSTERCTNAPKKGNPTTELKFPKGLRCEIDAGTLKGVIGNKEPIEIVGEMKIKNGRLESDTVLRSSWRNKNQIQEYFENGYALDEKGQRIVDVFINSDGKPKYTKELSFFSPKSVQQFSSYDLESDLGIAFDNPKPVALCKFLCDLLLDENDIVLDFFAGSSTTAQAVMELAIRAKFILIQLPEEIDEKNTDTAKMRELCASIGAENNIAELGKERIRRAGDKVKADLLDKHKALFDDDGELKPENQSAETNPHVLDPNSLDIGFKSFRIEDTKINWLKKDLRGEDLEAEAGLTTQDALDFVPGFTDQDIVYELMLRQSNIPLTHSISQPDNTGDRTYLYGDAYLVCLEESITKELVETLAALEPTPLKYFFRDSAFGKDIALKDETFRRLNAEIAKNFGDDAEAYTVEFI